MRQSMAMTSTSVASTEVSAKTTVFSISTTMSVSAREVCICFCAMRPAKSLSK